MRKSSHRCRVTGRSSRGKRLGRAVTETGDWNAKIIAEFRANEGRVGGGFEGAPITLVHHRGRKSGREYVSPMMYLADDDETIYVFAWKAGAAGHDRVRAAVVRVRPGVPHGRWAGAADGLRRHCAHHCDVRHVRLADPGRRLRNRGSLRRWD